MSKLWSFSVNHRAKDLTGENKAVGLTRIEKRHLPEKSNIDGNCKGDEYPG